MKKLLIFFLKSKYYERIHPFIAKKIFKIFKIFFVETELEVLPSNNYKLNEEDIVRECEKLQTIKNHEKPYITYTHLVDLITVMPRNNLFNFFDYGAGNLNLYHYLNKKIKNLNYFFYDQEKIIKILKNDKKIISLNNLKINFDINDNKYDLVYFGSSLQYLQNYEREIFKFKKKTRYLLISQTPFFKNENFDKKVIILKQINMHPNINYLYAFNYDYFINYMKNNNFKLVEKNFNRVTKFLNFKNFKDDFQNIDMYDLLFECIE